MGEDMLLDSGATHKVIEKVLIERSRQDTKWGEQNHTPFQWLSILAEEFGEAARALNEAAWGDGSWDDYLKETIETAAVAVAMVESFTRQKQRAQAEQE